MPAWAWACPEEGAVRRSLVARLPFSPAATRRGRSGRPQLRGTYQTCSTTPGVRTFNSDLPIDDQPRLQPERREQALPLTIATFAQTAPTLPGTQHQCRRAVACTPRTYSRHGRDLSCRAPALARVLGWQTSNAKGPPRRHSAASDCRLRYTGARALCVAIQGRKAHTGDTGHYK